MEKASALEEPLRYASAVSHTKPEEPNSSRGEHKKKSSTNGACWGASNVRDCPRSALLFSDDSSVWAGVPALTRPSWREISQNRQDGTDGAWRCVRRLVHRREFLCGWRGSAWSRRRNCRQRKKECRPNTLKRRPSTRSFVTRSGHHSTREEVIPFFSGLPWASGGSPRVEPYGNQVWLEVPILIVSLAH